MKATKPKYILVGILVIFIAAVAYQFLQTEKENPAVTLCEQQFRQGTAGNYSGFFACITEAAVAQLDPAICGTRMDTRMQSDCMKVVIAAAPEDPAVYEKLRNPWLRAMFQYQKGNLSSEEFNPSYSIDEYFLDIIVGEIKLSFNVSEKHIFICEEIDSVYTRSKCYMAIVLATNNTSICERIQVISSKDGCYWNTVFKTPDPTVCEKIVDVVMRSDCYSMVASMTKDESICDKVEFPERKDTCYASVAEATLDTSVCDKIGEENVRAYCKTKVSAMVGA